jgi:hypothetical protein
MCENMAGGRLITARGGGALLLMNMLEPKQLLGGLESNSICEHSRRRWSQDGTAVMSEHGRRKN